MWHINKNDYERQSAVLTGSRKNKPIHSLS